MSFLLWAKWNITVALMEPRSVSGPANMLERRTAPEVQANQQQNKLSPPHRRLFLLHCYQLGCRHGARLQRGHGEAETPSLPLPSLCSFSWRSNSVRGVIQCDKLLSHPKKKAHAGSCAWSWKNRNSAFMCAHVCTLSHRFYTLYFVQPHMQSQTIVFFQPTDLLETQVHGDAFNENHRWNISNSSISNPCLLGQLLLKVNTELDTIKIFSLTEHLTWRNNNWPSDAIMHR